MRPAREKQFGKLIQREFTRQAEEFSRSREMREKGGLEILPALAGVRPAERVLDIACGPGFVAIEFARHAREVVGVDLTAGMLKEARALARREGLDNVTFRRADVNHLPFADASFDVVATRASFHHFLRPDKVLGEMARVLKDQGRILISDCTSKNEAEKSRRQNRIEKLRDPSHVEMLPLRKWRALFQNAGLRVVREKRLVQRRDAEEWMALSRTPAAARRTIRRLFRRAMPGDRTGQHVRVVRGRIVFDMNYRIFVLERREVKRAKVTGFSDPPAGRSRGAACFR